MFTHVVFFWFNPGTPANTRAAMIESVRNDLKKIPSVRVITAGAAAMTKRAVVDNSYDVGLCVVFDDSAGHDEYQAHALHQEFLTKYKSHWAKILAYDFV